MSRNADDVPVVEYTVRAPCRACGRLFVWPKGSRPPGGLCSLCQPALDERPVGRVLEPEQLELVDDQDEEDEGRERPPTPAPEDALCAGCRDRRADGVLSPPGVPLCLGCAEEVLEHWLAWLVEPSHDWWAPDDVFGSARHPVEGWRSTELGDGRVAA